MLEELRTFDAVARTGSFTAAAVELNYTQSAVSRRVAALETEAGGPLFERMARGVRLTPSGEALHRHAREVLDRMADAREELRVIHEGAGGRLRVGAFATANVALVPAALGAFRAERPHVELSMVEGLSNRLLAHLEEGAIDLAVVSDWPYDVDSTDRIALTPLIDDELLVALRRDHPLAGQDVVDLRDLKDESWIEGAQAGCMTRLGESCARAGYTPRVGFRIWEWTGKFGYVSAGLGVTLVPVIAAQSVPADLVVRSMGEYAPRRRVYVALPRAHPLPAACALLRLLVSAAARMEPCTSRT